MTTIECRSPSSFPIFILLHCSINIRLHAKVLCYRFFFIFSFPLKWVCTNVDSTFMMISLYMQEQSIQNTCVSIQISYSMEPDRNYFLE